MPSFEEKCTQLEARLALYAKNDVMLAFSGGVDSSLLLETCCRAAHAAGTTLHTMTIRTTLHPSGEADAAMAAARAAGAVPHLLDVDELTTAGIENNPVDRCYRCKKTMFTEVCKVAAQLGIPTVLDGTNADDLQQYRPGIRALRELGIDSPLALCHFTKADVRRLAAVYGIAAADKPANPCMATRFPYGARLDYAELHKAEQAETLIRAQGFYNVRARVHDALLRIEVDKPDIPRLVACADNLVPALKALGYDYISVDLEGFRSGSQDLHLTQDS